MIRLSSLNAPGEWLPIGTEVPGLAGEFFLVTGSGKYFRNIIVDRKYVLQLLNWMKPDAITYSLGAGRGRKTDK